MLKYMTSHHISEVIFTFERLRGGREINILVHIPGKRSI